MCYLKEELVYKNVEIAKSDTSHVLVNLIIIYYHCYLAHFCNQSHIHQFVHLQRDSLDVFRF